MSRYNSDNFLPFGLCPGPKQPKDLDSFLIPFIEELNRLNDGVQAYDAHSKTSFLLRAHLVLVTGDTPGISKLLHLNGHSAKLPCRACKLEGVPFQIPFTFKSGPREGQRGNKSQYYYPINKPTNSRSMSVALPRFVQELCAIPRRTAEGYINDGRISQRDPKLAVLSGIKGISPLTILPTISFPDAAPFDIMHLGHLGFVPLLCSLLSGTFFAIKELNDYEHGRMPIKEWEALGVDMKNIGAPVSWGRYPRNIQLYIKGFKAEELSNFLIHYLLPLSFNRVNSITFRALQRLVFIFTMATSYQIEMSQVMEIENHLVKFIKWYYDTYYQYQQERLPACKYTVHALLHLVQDIKNWGPASYYWQYPEVIRF
jgi:Transposase family tnp2